MENDIIIGGIPGSVILIIIGNWLKAKGVEALWIGPINVVIGVALCMAWTALHNATPEQYFISGVLGFYIGAASAGLYSSGKAVKGE